MTDYKDLMEQMSGISDIMDYIDMVSDYDPDEDKEIDKLLVDLMGTLMSLENAIEKHLTDKERSEL